MIKTRQKLMHDQYSVVKSKFAVGDVVRINFEACGDSIEFVEFKSGIRRFKDITSATRFEITHIGTFNLILKNDGKRIKFVDCKNEKTGTACQCRRISDIESKAIIMQIPEKYLIKF